MTYTVVLKPARLLAAMGPVWRTPTPQPACHRTPRSDPPYQQRQTVLEDRLPATNKRPPHNIATAKTPPPLIHTSPGPTQTPHAPPQPAAAATPQPKPRSGPHYGTEFFISDFNKTTKQKIGPLTDTINRECFQTESRLRNVPKMQMLDASVYVCVYVSRCSMLSNHVFRCVRR
jgi:hypothetical protein